MRLVGWIDLVRDRWDSRCTQFAVVFESLGQGLTPGLSWPRPPVSWKSFSLQDRTKAVLFEKNLILALNN